MIKRENGCGKAMYLNLLINFLHLITSCPLFILGPWSLCNVSATTSKSRESHRTCAGLLRFGKSVQFLYQIL